MLHLLIAEAALELVPEELWSHPVVVATARRRNKKPSEIILDSSLHHNAMWTLPDAERRGRPDIVHTCLLVALDSILNKKNMLRVLIHTRNDELISVNPGTRVIKNYDRFVGLIEQLFEKQCVPDEQNPLLTIEKDYTIQKILKRYPADVVLGFDTGNHEIQLPLIFKELKKQKKQELVCIIGGFPKGSFRCNLHDLADTVVSLYQEMVPAWTIVSEILVNYENVFTQKNRNSYR
ncbi:MAG: 16S rRNA methyltransferase [Candidatus Thermoplasmatota archaeon]